jgi:hypothetical protein
MAAMKVLFQLRLENEWWLWLILICLKSEDVKADEYNEAFWDDKLRQYSKRPCSVTQTLDLSSDTFT